jgi:hypothetical protein
MRLNNLRRLVAWPSNLTTENVLPDPNVSGYFFFQKNINEFDSHTVPSKGPWQGAKHLRHLVAWQLLTQGGYARLLQGNLDKVP